MTRQHIPHRMSLPPPTAISFVSWVILAVIAIVLTGVVVASAPRTVMLSMAAALGGVLVVTAVLAAIERSRPTRMRPVSTSPGAGGANGAPHSDDEVSRPPTRELTWLTLGVGSMAILALAVVVPDDVGAVLAAIAFVGLAVFRVSVGWAFRVLRAGPSDEPRGAPRRVSREDSHAATAEPSGPSTGLAAA